MIAIIDSGIANLGSVRRALSELGAEAVVADSPNELRGAENRPRGHQIAPSEGNTIHLS